MAGKLNISWETAGKAPGNGRETTQPPLPHQGRQDHRASGAMAHRTCDTFNTKKDFAEIKVKEKIGAKG